MREKTFFSISENKFFDSRESFFFYLKKVENE